MKEMSIQRKISYYIEHNNYDIVTEETIRHLCSHWQVILDMWLLSFLHFNIKTIRGEYESEGWLSILRLVHVSKLDPAPSMSAADLRSKGGDPHHPMGCLEEWTRRCSW